MTVAARADPSLYVVSSQPAVINPVVHCLYFLPGPQLFPSHRASTTLNAWIITPPRHTMSDIYLSIYTSYYRWQPAHIMTSHCNLRTCLVTRCKCWDEPQSIDISDQWMVTAEDALTLYSKSEHDQTTSVFKLTTLMTETGKDNTQKWCCSTAHQSNRPDHWDGLRQTGQLCWTTFILIQ